MAVAEQSKNYVTFTGGLNTEATVLNFPENAATEIDNFDLVRTGELRRRLGLDFETSYAIRTEATADTYMTRASISTSEWRAVNGKGNINFQVVQVGMNLYFHDLGAEPTSTNLRGTVNLAPYKTESDADYKVMDMSYGQGVLIVCNPGMNSVYITYDETAVTFAATVINIQIRDFDGVDDGLAVDERPTVSTAAHTYNLRNQGWPLLTAVVLSRGGSEGTYIGIDPLGMSSFLVGYYPNNADIFWACKSTASKAGKEEAIGAYSPWTLQDQATGNTPAPKGHYIFDLFNQNKSTVSGLTLPASTTKSTTARPSTTVFYAGRVWYAGVADKNYTGQVLYSQIITDITKIGKCYQDQDPTAEDLNSLLATDGGLIHIADMGEVYRMVVSGQDLVIIAANGAWAVSGATGANFKATEFTVRKLTDTGAIGRDTVVLAENVIFWWSKGGIWLMQSGQIDDKFTLDRISKETIQTFYEENISQGAKVYARGFYDEFTKRIIWLYNDDPAYDAVNFRYKYNRALILDMSLPAFYTYTLPSLPTNSPFVAAMSKKDPGNAATSTYDVVLVLDTIELSGDIIVQDITYTQYANNKIKLLTFVQNEDATYSYTFSEFNSLTFKDWGTWDLFKHGAGFTGVNFDSKLQTGWQDFQAPLNSKHITHITSYFKRTETGYTVDGSGNTIFTNPSGALIQMRWEWTDADIRRWTTAEEAYRLNQYYIPLNATDPFTYGFTIVSSKLRVRGHGHAFSVRYISTPGNDMRLVGFSVNLRGVAKL